MKEVRMSDNLMVSAPVVEVTPPLAQVPAEQAPGTTAPAPTAEQAQVADRVFTTSPDSEAMLGFLGLWTGLLILHDLAVEHFDTAETDEEANREQPTPGPQPE
jgi:hypothetical protein